MGKILLQKSTPVARPLKRPNFDKNKKALLAKYLDGPGLGPGAGWPAAAASPGGSVALLLLRGRDRILRVGLRKFFIEN